MVRNHDSRQAPHQADLITSFLAKDARPSQAAAMRAWDRIQAEVLQRDRPPAAGVWSGSYPDCLLIVLAICLVGVAIWCATVLSDRQLLLSSDPLLCVGFAALLVNVAAVPVSALLVVRTRRKHASF